MRRCTRLAAAGGFTLVELLVVVAIIGLLMAMLLPAIQQARETARRSSCVNNMRQIGVAVHMYHNAHDAFPPGAVVTGPNPTDPTYTSWTIQILPFLEQREIYDLYSQIETNESPANKIVRETFISSYSCPSDIYRNVPIVPDSGPAATERVPYMPGSYRGVGGKSDGSSGSWDGVAVKAKQNPSYKQLPRRWKGVFHVVDKNLRPESFAAVTDGLSNTLMVGEYSTAPSKSIGKSNGMSRRTFWAYTYGPYNRSEAVPESRTLLGDLDRCSRIGGQGDFQPCNRAWGSFHTDLLNFLLCDGSVQTFSVTIDTKIFAEAATIAGKEFARCRDTERIEIRRSACYDPSMGRPFVAGLPGRHFLCGLTICWVVAATGCQRTIAPVSGRVTLNGKPLANAVVTFQPQAERDKKYPAATGSVGHTDKQGRYMLRVVKPDQLGAVVGDHIVTISTAEPESDAIPATDYPLPLAWRDGSKSFQVPPNGTAEANFAITITEPPPKASKKRK